MQIQTESICIRCGKVRIVGKTWLEKMDRGNPITHTETICPDKECQKIVDADFAAKREKKLLITTNRAAQAAATAAATASAKLS